MTKDMWFEAGGGITHWCAGKSDDKKHNNKPDMRVTHTDMTKWFNPTTLDSETGVVTCIACGGSPKDGDTKTSVDIHNVGE